MGSTAYLIDNDAVFRFGLKHILEKSLDIEVIGQSRQSAAGLEQAARHHPDIVIIDPGRQIYETLATIRRFSVTSPKTRIVLLSEHMGFATVREALVLRLDGYAMKPISQVEIRSLLEHVSRGEQFITPNFENHSSLVDNLTNKENCRTSKQRSDLSDRETQILVRTVNGRTAADIAREFDISIKTAEWHRRNVYSKLQVTNVAQLTKYALRAGIITLD